jgi:hypothetical protein
MNTRRTSIETARERFEVARLRELTLASERRAAILSKYDATESNKFRRQPSVERSNEGEIYDMTRRAYGCN